jgi:hypothetical protein
VTGIALPGGVTLYGEGASDPAAAAVQAAFSGFSTYTPSLTAATPPTLGLGSAVEGFYLHVGNLVTGNARIGFGSSGTNEGVGTYGFTLPVEPVDGDRPIGTCRIVHVGDGSVIPFRLCALAVVENFYAPSLSTAVIFQDNVDGTEGLGNGGNPAGPGVPFTWGPFDSFSVEFEYESAQTA